MTEQLHNVLYEGEKVIWEGKAEPFGLLDPPYRKPLFITWIVSAVILIGSLAFYLPRHLPDGIHPDHFLITLVAVNTIPFLLSFQPINTKQVIEKQLSYVFTNQRALSISGHTINAFAISRSTPCRIELLPNGSGIIYMGEGCKLKSTESRNAAVHRIKDADSDVLSGMVFYGVKDPLDVCKSFTPFESITQC